MTLHGENKPVLLIESELEAFPEKAQAEIREERRLGEEEGEFPKSKIEIVLGARGLLYVILPTEMETELPFACNAPSSRIQIAVGSRAFPHRRRTAGCWSAPGIWPRLP